MKLLIDMNLSPRWVATLKAAGFEPAHWSSLGKPDSPDREIMAFAAANGFVVVTHDLDFGAILATTGGLAPSVVQIRADDLRPESIGPHLILALKQMGAELDAGALLSVDPLRARLALLPLRSRP